MKKHLPALLLALALFSPLVFSQAPQHGATLSWTEVNNSDTAVGFNVYRSTTSGSGYTKLNAAVVPAATLTYLDSTGVGGTTYFYVVRAVDNLGIESANSNEASGTAVGANPQHPALQVVEQ